MPAFAVVFGQFPCPFCGNIADRLEVQWGRLPSAYNMGDTVGWHTREDRIVPPWTYKWSERVWNAGDPSVLHVFVRDSNNFHAAREPRCPNCGAILGGAVVEVDNNRLVRGALLKPGELPEGQYLVVGEDDSLARMMEWENKRLEGEFDV